VRNRLKSMGGRKNKKREKKKKGGHGWEKQIENDVK
jgi:hypothetical protein